MCGTMTVAGRIGADMDADRVGNGGDRLGRLTPFVGLVTAAAAVVVVLLIREERAALWLNRFHDLATVVYALLFGLVLVAAVIALTSGSVRVLGEGLRAALLWSGIATAYTLLAAALDLPSGEGSVFVTGALSAYLGTAVAVTFWRLGRGLTGALRGARAG